MTFSYMVRTISVTSSSCHKYFKLGEERNRLPLSKNYSNSHIKSNNQMASWKCSTWNQVRTWPCQSPSSPWTSASQAKEAQPTWLSTLWWRQPWPQAARLLSTGWTLAGLMDGGRQDVNFLKDDPLPGSSTSADCKKWQPFLQVLHRFQPCVQSIQRWKWIDWSDKSMGVPR